MENKTLYRRQGNEAQSRALLLTEAQEDYEAEYGEEQKPALEVKSVSASSVENVSAVPAGSIDAAMYIHRESGGGQMALNWVLAYPEKARKILKGNYRFFFPKTGDSDFVWVAFWEGSESKGRFGRYFEQLSHEWKEKKYRVVLHTNRPTW